MEYAHACDVQRGALEDADEHWQVIAKQMEEPRHGQEGKTAYVTS